MKEIETEQELKKVLEMCYRILGTENKDGNMKQICEKDKSICVT